jgi:hypothetical protein
MARHEKNTGYRPFSPDTVALAERIIREVKGRGVIGKYALATRILNLKSDLSINNALIYITETEPRIAETDDGKLMWVDGR